jgi:hypothetical protein
MIEPDLFNGYTLAFGGVCTAAGATFMKCWPMIAKSRAEAMAQAAGIAAAKVETEAKIAKEKLDDEARIKRDAHAQVSAEYEGIIDRQQKQLDRQQVQIDALTKAMQRSADSHTLCLVENAELRGRLTTLERLLNVRPVEVTLPALLPAAPPVVGDGAGGSVVTMTMPPGSSVHVDPSTTKEQ